MTRLSGAERQRRHREKVKRERVIPKALLPEVTDHERVTLDRMKAFEKDDLVATFLTYLVSQASPEGEDARPSGDDLRLAARAAELLDKLRSVRRVMYDTQTGGIVAPVKQNFREVVAETASTGIAYHSLVLLRDDIAAGTATPKDLLNGLRAADTVIKHTSIVYTEADFWEALYLAMARNHELEGEGEGDESWKDVAASLHHGQAQAVAS